MELQLLKALLSVEFYVANKDRLTRRLFHDDAQELYDVVVASHNKFGCDLTTTEIFELWRVENPTATDANLALMREVINKMNGAETIRPEVASVIIESLWKKDIGHRLAKYGISITEGDDTGFLKARELLAKAEQGFMPTDFPPDEQKDLTKLLDEMDDKNRIRFNIPALQAVIPGLNRTEFCVVIARPNTGKTAFGVSLSCGPYGFAEQGYRVVMLGNEEKASRTLVRCYSAWTGMRREELVNSPALAQERFELISEKVTVQNILGWPLDEVEAFLKYKEADIAIIDQLDKVSIPGNYDSPHLRLRELYTRSREIPLRTNSVLIGFSQASADGEGRTIILPDYAEGSKTGKYAEADLFLGIGKAPDNADGSENFVRYITSGKNKINGWHGTITCRLDAQVSRYTN